MPSIFSIASSNCLAHLAPVHSSFAKIYHATSYSSGSPSQSRRLVILPWLAAIETHKNMILQTTNKRWWWVSQIRQENLKFLLVLTQQQAMIDSRHSQNSQSLDRAITRESQTHDVDVCGAGKAYNMVAKRVSNNQFRDAKLNKRSTRVLCWS